MNKIDNNLIDAIHDNIDSIEVVLRINMMCNQKCIFCFVDINSTNFFSFEDVKNQIIELKKIYNGKKIEFVITGGEPTINPDFIKIIEYLYNNGDYIRVQTNAVYFGNKSNFNKIIKYLDKIDFFISFHSSNEKIYNYITQTSGQFDLAVLGIKNLLKYNKVEINIVLNSLNINFLGNYFKFLGENFKNIGEFVLNISIMTNIYKYKQADKMLVNYTKIAEKINNSEDIIKKYNINIADSFGAPCDMPFCIGKKLFYFKDKVYTKSRIIGDRTKIENCKFCKYDNFCNGILKLYIEKFGSNEFIAIRD
ncbi:radical SAM protein [Candidatus Gracilibacteria bacterium]|nr:radical SAM protein [Candidatus Gracilibacteria bacterium]